MNERHAKRITAEILSIQLDGADRCTSVTGSQRCERVQGHVGCHYAQDTRMYATWASKGEKLGALYPRGT